jgi:prepilin-type processing-associated H-X9-DG protein/prepilin-type N-terminal cleavage/methylation domain-containing protein
VIGGRTRNRSTSALPRAGGFTLVELLVVIGIIGVLISILMPTLSKVRRRAQATECAANLHTFGQAWQLYANANHGVCVPGRLPTSGAPGGVYSIDRSSEYRPHWYELLGEQVQQYANLHPKDVQDDKWTISNRVFLCPAVPDWNNSRNFPYGYNYQFLGNARHRMDGGWINYPIKVARINGAHTVMAADSMGTAAGLPRTSRTKYYEDGTHDAAAWCNKGWCIDPPRLTGDSDYADPQHRDPQARAGPDPRHMGKCNVVFCDGHVELLAPQEIGYVVEPDGSMPASDPHASNAWFSGSAADVDPPPIRKVTTPPPGGH